MLAQGDMFAVGREGTSRRWTRLYNGVSDGAGRGRLSVRSVVITLESPEDRCFEMEITAAVDHLVTLRQKRVKWSEQHHSLRPLCSVPARRGGDLDLCVDSLEMGEKEAWSTRLASHQRGVIYGVAETGVPGPVSQWGSAKGGRLGKSENPTSPTIPMRMCPSVFMQPRHWGGEESVCEREREREREESRAK